MSGYFDRRSELFQQVFRDALSYPEYLATGNVRERAAWARAEAALPQDASVRLDPAGRIVNVLCLSGIWAGTASGRSRSWHEWPGRQGRPLICASWTGTPFRNFEMSSGFWEPCGFPWWSSLPRTSMRSAATGIGRSPSIGRGDGSRGHLPASGVGGRRRAGRRNRRVAGHVAMASGLAVAGLPRVVEMLTDEDGDEIWNLSDALIGLLDTKEASRGTSTDSQPTATPH